MTPVKLPDLGEGIAEAIVSHWYVKVGDRVKEGDDMVELVSDKASFNIPAAADGVLKEIFFKTGDHVKIGQALALIE